MAASAVDSAAPYVALNTPIVIGFIACVLCHVVVGAQTSESGGVIIRTYNAAGLHPTTTEAGQGAAADLLAAAGIPVRWRDCGGAKGPAATAHDGCDARLAARELIVRIVTTRGIRYDDGEALGFSYVDVEARRGTLATVFADRIHALATERYFDESTLLGRAIAHEIGHPLLGTATHPKTGLMQGHWATDGRIGDWAFSAAEGAGMREGLEARDDATLPAMVPPTIARRPQTKKKGEPEGSPAR